MSTIVDGVGTFGQRLRAQRQSRGWSLERLAMESGVSRAMISKVERGESSPTAIVLGKLSAALQLTMSELLAGPGPLPQAADAVVAEAGTVTAAGHVRRADGTPQWQDPDTGYVRRQLSTARFPASVTEVILPPGARVPYPAGSYAFIAQLVWVLHGELTLADGPVCHVLAVGDTFELGAPQPREFRNETTADCRYLVVVTRV